MDASLLQRIERLEAAQDDFYGALLNSASIDADLFAALKALRARLDFLEAIVPIPVLDGDAA